MAFRSRSQRRTKKFPESVTIEFSPDASTFNLQILESNLFVLTGSGKKGKWKKTHVVLQSGKGVFTSLLFYKKPSKFIAKLAPLEKHDLHCGFDVSLGEVIKGKKYTIDITTHGPNGVHIRLAADSEELRNLWIHELITKIIVDPLSPDCIKWFVVRIKDTVGTNRLKLSGKCSLYVYQDKIVLATIDGVMLGEFPLSVIKSYKCSEEFHLSLSAGSMYGDITLFIITEQRREIFENIHRLKMRSMGREDELPPPTINSKFILKQTPDDTSIRVPSRLPSKRDFRGKLQDSASETDILAAVMASDKPTKPPLPRILLNQAVRSHSNASAFMKPREFSRIQSPSMYGRDSDLLQDSGEFSSVATTGRRPSEPPMLHSDRKNKAQFQQPDNPMLSSLKTHSQFTTPDLYDHAIFKPRPGFQAINETAVASSLNNNGSVQYDSIKTPPIRKKVNIYESLSFGKSDKTNAFLKPPGTSDIPDIPVTCPNPPKEPSLQERNFSLSNSLSAPHNISELSDESFSSQNPSVFSSVSPPPPPPLSEKMALPRDDSTHYSDLFKAKVDPEYIKPTSSLKGLHSYKRASRSNHYETINFGFHTLGSGRRKAVRFKLGKAKSEMPPGMLVGSESDDNVLKVNKKTGTRPSSVNLSKEKQWEVN